MRVDADRVALALECLGETAECDVPLGTLTTYRVGGNAAIMVRLTDRSVLGPLAEALRVSGLPILVVGRGSNMLVADAGFAGIVLAVATGAEHVELDAASGVVEASAGVALPVLARKTAAGGLRGFEWAVGVPGSVGGAVRMNAGGHGSDMAACLIDAEVADLRTGTTSTWTVDDLDLGFRSSALDAHDLVLAARLRLAPGDASAARHEIDEIVAWRRANQPGGQNAGSVFVNPVPGEVSAGQLIDAAGLRGWRIGTAVVSDKHANFIQADEGGSADDVHALMVAVRDRIAASTGYVLRSEVRLVGFDGGQDLR